MTWGPAASAVVVKTAWLPLRFAVPNSTLPSRNCTVPVGTIPLPETAAVKVTACPTGDGLMLLVSVTEATSGAGGTTEPFTRKLANPETALKGDEAEGAT